MAGTTRHPPGIWRDTPGRYGLVSRILHWLMALLILWQFALIILFRLFGASPVLLALARFGPHGVVGLAILVLVLLRGGWGILNARHRPPYGAGLAGRAAFAGHLSLYVLMFVIPAIALLRTYGSGRGWSPYGFPLIPESGVEVGWMIAPAQLGHGRLSWLLLALIAGHVAMSLLHRFRWRDGRMARMTGPLRRDSLHFGVKGAATEGFPERGRML